MTQPQVLFDSEVLLFFYGIDDKIIKYIQGLVVYALAERGFIRHARLLHHPAAGGVVFLVRGTDFVEMANVQKIIENRAKCLGGVALAVAVKIQAVADLTVSILFLKLFGFDVSDQLSALFALDRPVERTVLIFVDPEGQAHECVIDILVRCLR